MTPVALAELVRSVADDVLTRRGLDPAVLPAPVTVERPRHPAHGDYATTVALQTASRTGVPPRELAGWLAQALTTHPAVRCAEVAGPGFINLRLTAADHATTRSEIIRQVLAAGERYGPGELGPAAPDGLAIRCPSRWPAHRAVQYAHARLAALTRNAAELGVTAQLGLLEHEQEGELARTLGEFPLVVVAAARVGDPYRVARYLEQVASWQHNFSDVCRLLPMGDEEPGPRHGARLALCQATRQVLANGLGLLGLSAPERM
ncbi:MAG TPA: DALR anticodon-binding domain-containing protein [Pseudonocardiaceae bacterium]|nr:DALR anticodon-binding domain-containing protein [Pseudonocardiaceae bacterium]